MAAILIVDDDEDFLRLLSQYFESMGLQHDLAAGAQQARTLLKGFRYDVVVSDFDMPGETGLDLFRYVSSVYPETRFALMTGRGPEIKREAMKMGVGAFIQKPFYLSELRRIVINLMHPLEPDDQKEVAGFDRCGPCLRSRLKIAFCGDDDGEFLIVRSVLEKAGYGDAIWACALGEKSLVDSFCSHDGNFPDVILLDMLMLFEGGAENLEKIKTEARLRNVPLLLMAVAPEFAQAVLSKYPHLQIEGILSKPVTLDSLANLLKPYRECV